MALGSRYDEVQAAVNRILSGGSSSSGSFYDVDALARRVIAGEFGTVLRAPGRRHSVASVARGRER